METLSILAISAVVLGFVLHKYANRIPEVDLPHKTITLPCIFFEGEYSDMEDAYGTPAIRRSVEYVEFTLHHIVYTRRAVSRYKVDTMYDNVCLIRDINGVSYLVLMSHPDLLKLIYSKSNT